MPRLLTFDELRDHGVPYVRSHLARLEAQGAFPKRVTIGDCRIGWVEDEIEAWVTKRINARSAPTKRGGRRSAAPG
jgi:prophage regulatory protein